MTIVGIAWLINCL